MISILAAEIIEGKPNDLNPRNHKGTQAMSKHTKEPWIIHEFDDELFVGIPKSSLNGPVNLGEIVFSMDFQDYTNEAKLRDKENAKRVVECVNFCAGFTNEQLKEMGDLKRLHGNLMVLQQERQMQTKQ